MFRPIIWLAAAAAFAATPALAQRSTVKVGIAHVNINSSTTGLKGAGVPPGADIEVGDATTLYFTYEYKLAPGWGIELAAGLPPTHDTKAAGSIAFLGKVSSIKQAGPTLFVNYHFGSEGAQWRPMVGVGINYTKFYDAQSEYGQDIELSDSVGLAAQVGVAYAISKEWGVCAGVAVAKVKSDLVATGTTVQTTTIDFRPVVFTLAATYKF